MIFYYRYGHEKAPDEFLGSSADQSHETSTAENKEQGRATSVFMAYE